VVGGIYSPNHQSGRWGRLLSKGAPDSPVRQPCHPTVGFDRWSFWQLGPPNSPLVHRTVTVHCPVRLLAPALTLRAQSRTVHCTLLQSTVGAVAVTPLRTPDSPVLHRIVRWIIAEDISRNPKVASSELISLVHRTLSGGAPDTVRWHTGQSDAPDQGYLRLSFALFIWTLSWTFYWFVLILWHL
jgi:hypothetical protein